MQVRTVTVQAVDVEYDEFGFIKDYICPRCGAKVKFSHEDDIGTKFFKCEKCDQCSSKLKTPRRKELETYLKELTEPVTLEKICEILNSTIKHDERNKLITFLVMLQCCHNVATTSKKVTEKRWEIRV